MSTALALAPNRPRSRQLVLRVHFRGLDGRRWRAIGGGATADEAIAFARGSCPPGTAWRAVGVDALYGD